ncbi:carboxypeptidase B-like [Daphnia carinata]|uniref:carboxypeptidase B-like n=1 Tax=Daphnia carinata TaxID=120202 RepID=UPI00257AB132|nr:carboxypeptidase B-like [Daphnia carinata]
MSLLLVALIFNCLFIACFTVSQEHVWTDEVVSYSGFQLWSITPHNKEGGDFLRKIQHDYELDVWKESRSGNNTTDVLIPPDFQTELKLRLADADIPYVVTISDVQTVINSGNSNVTISNEIFKAQGHNMDWTSYHRLGDIYDYLAYLTDTYPQFVTLIDIGRSYEGRPLYVVRISSAASPDTNPAIWIDAEIHAREWISSALATYIIHQLVEVDSNADLWSNVDWYLMPMINPDGYEFTHTKNRLWRKSRSRRGKICRGVDLNRNFGYKWGGLGAGRMPCTEFFRGPAAFSEPETIAVSNFILSKSHKIKVFLTLHSFGQLILLPWAYGVKAIYPRDYDELLALAENAASKFVRFKYSVGNTVELLYPAPGSSFDWAKSIGIKYSYGVELGNIGIYGIVIPPSLILPICEDFFPALKVFADKAATMTNM